MNSKVLMVVALLFAGSAVASPEGHENITLGMKPSVPSASWFSLKGPQEAAESAFDFTRHLKTEVAQPTKFARFKEVVVNNPYKIAAVVVGTVAVITAVIVAASSKNEVVAEEENYFA